MPRPVAETVLAGETRSAPTRTRVPSELASRFTRLDGSPCGPEVSTAPAVMAGDRDDLEADMPSTPIDPAQIELEANLRLLGTTWAEPPAPAASPDPDEALLTALDIIASAHQRACQVPGLSPDAREELDRRFGRAQDQADRAHLLLRGPGLAPVEAQAAG